MGGRRYLLVKGRAGMGNRIMCLLTAILYARLSQRRLVVDWSDGVYSPDGSDVFHRLFACRSSAPREELPEEASVVPAPWRGRLSLSPRELEAAHGPDSTIDVTRLDYAEDIAVLSTYDTQIHLLRHHLGPDAPETPALAKRTMDEELALLPGIRARIEDFRSRHLGGPAVGVHVRMTDYRVPVGPALRELDALLGREPGLQVFLATDNVEAKELFERRYPGVVTAPHWYPAPGVPLHGSPDCPDRLENAVEALVDLHLLGGCDHIVGDTGSAFTRVAGLLQPEGAHGIIDIRPRRSRRRLLHRWLWSRYMWGQAPGWRVLRRAVRAANLSTLPAKAQLLRSRLRTAGVRR